MNLLLLAPLLFSSAIAAPQSPAPDAPAPQWAFKEVGNSGILALESIIVSPTLALFFDRASNDTLQIDGHSAWGALFDLQTNTPSPLRLVTNSFCASGTFLSNGTMVGLGGSSVEFGPTDGDVSGLMGIRIFEPCASPSGAGCTVFEDPQNLHLAVPRWYTSTIRISDGSIMIIGGINQPTGFYNDAVNGQFSFEFFPKKDGGVPRDSPFLRRTLPANLFPRAFSLPDGKVFMIANNQTIIYDIEAQTETPGPDIPNGVRVTNPFDGTAALLPLSPPNYTPEVLVCGGTNLSDSLPPLGVSSQDPASTQCSRITVTPAGLQKGWEVEQMLNPRMMPEMILLPNGQVVILNGARTGAAALSSVSDVIGNSNADHPVLTPELYTPTLPLGQRITSKGLPTTTIPRLYHSTVTLTGMGNLLIAGSNPNANVTLSGVKFPTELRVETLNPPFMFVQRPVLVNPPAQIRFGQKFTVSVNIPANLNTQNIQVSLMDLGFSSHAWHSSARLVFLESTLSRDKKTLTLTAPPNGNIYPPGPAFLFITVDDVTGVGAKVLVGSGGAPPVSD